MGMTNEKMYGSYSDADLNDWEKFPMNANVLTSSAFGAWLLRRDERRDKAISKADYENRLKADMVDILNKLKTEIIKYEGDCRLSEDEYPSCKQCTDNVFETIYAFIDKYKAESEGKE